MNSEFATNIFVISYTEKSSLIIFTQLVRKPTLAHQEKIRKQRVLVHKTIQTSWKTLNPFTIHNHHLLLLLPVPMQRPIQTTKPECYRKNLNKKQLMLPKEIRRKKY